jgi:3-hydroxyisobutyrate dehydrogenase-like beta-hydroxyacid dehydrogenase
MCAGIIRAVGEAMAFACARGLPLERVVETLGQGAGSSWYFVHRAPFMIREAYPPGFRIRTARQRFADFAREMAAAGRCGAAGGRGRAARIHDLDRRGLW